MEITEKQKEKIAEIAEKYGLKLVLLSLEKEFNEMIEDRAAEAITLPPLHARMLSKI